MRYTTTNLRLDARSWWRIHERHIRDASWAGAFVVTLLLIHSLLSPQPEIAAAPLMAQVQRPVIMVQTATAGPVLPTATPWPTAAPLIIIQQVEVPGSAPAPEVQYVEVPVQVYVPIEAPPTLEPPPPPTLAPQQMVILDRQQWAEDAAQHNGGSGKMDAPDYGTMDANAQWCAAATNGARCK